VGLTINDAPSALKYSPNPAFYTKGVAIVPSKPSHGGGTVRSLSYAVVPPLPAGLNLDTTTGVISGTPSVVAAQRNYTVTASNSEGHATTAVSITVIGKISYSSSWVGNSFHGGGGKEWHQRKWVQGPIMGIFAAPDGTVYANTGWDEGGREAGVYKNGDAVSFCGFTHGWGYAGGESVTANGKYLFLAARMTPVAHSAEPFPTWPPSGKWWIGISRRLVYHPTNPVSYPWQAVPFVGAKGGSGGTLRGSFLLIHEIPTKGNDFWFHFFPGMTADEKHLFISDAFDNTIKVFDAEMMAHVTSFALDHPGAIVLDKKTDTLWIVQTPPSPGKSRIVHYSTDGTKLNENITPVDVPKSLAIDNQGRLLVAEGGVTRQIITYDISKTPRIVGNLGVHGGLHSGISGQVADLKLSPTAVSADAKGNTYVVNDLSVGSDLRAFSPQGKLLWKLHGLEMVDVATPDPLTDGQKWYTGAHQYTMDYSKANGQEGSLTGVTMNLERFSRQLRTTALAFRWLDGKPFWFGTLQNGGLLSIYRFDGLTAVPSGLLWPTGRHLNGWYDEVQPKTNWFLWRDLNGDGNPQANELFSDNIGKPDEAWGWDVDNAGTIRHTLRYYQGKNPGLKEYPLKGIENGTLIYDHAAAQDMAAPSPFTGVNAAVNRIKYVSESDTMYLSGYTSDLPQDAAYWGMAGTVLARYDKWRQGNRTPRWQIRLPFERGNWRKVKAFAVAGQRIFAGIIGSNIKEQMYVYDTETGALLGQMTPNPDFGRIGWIDMSHGISAVQRSNGEYVVFVEEVTFGKNLVYRGSMMTE
jgi:hypothetical protein